MRPRITVNLRALVAPNSGILWVTNSRFPPKSPSSLGSSPWPETASIRLYETLKKYQELEQMLKENRKALEKLNAMGMNHSLESIERSITIAKWLRKQAQEVYDKLSLPVRKLLEFRRLAGEYASRWFGTSDK
ncbi:uncharacterized protein FMAN_12827 [Fusarium mangiferae]|uniref:Uncharacterized protein n=1 Tax=Fusarium mangiferae TaxID=192010 RepID=A0A1L7U1U1_FUSMA|nr:uncharacterized protein FMAN_12827 [Fusarium mangiferae]CVL04718.1 uncharacterized protein FMAN_12827 [Fusarium mangiferae]